MSFNFQMVKSDSESGSALKKLWKNNYLPPFLPIYCFQILGHGENGDFFDPHGGTLNLSQTFWKHSSVPIWSFPRSEDLGRLIFIHKKVTFWPGLTSMQLKLGSRQRQKKTGCLKTTTSTITSCKLGFILVWVDLYTQGGDLIASYSI